MLNENEILIAAFNDAPDPMIITDVDFIITRINCRLLEILPDFDKYLNKHVSDAVEHYKGKSVLSQLEDILKKTEVYESIFPFKGEGDKLFWIKYIYAPLFDSTHQRLGSLIQFKIITYQDRNDDQLAIFHNFTELARQGLLVTDLDGKVIYINIFLANLLGYNDQIDLLGKDISFFYNKDRKNFYSDKILPELLINNQWQEEGIFNDVKGNKIYVMENFFLIRYSDNEFVYIVDIINDISHLKLVEENLKKSERIYRLVTENIGDVVWTVDGEKNVNYISPSVEKMLGYNRQDLLSQELSFLFPEKYLNRIRELLERSGSVMNIADSLHDLPFECQLKKNDGTLIWTETVIKQLNNVDDNLNGIVGVTRDITARKTAEIELLRFRWVVENSLQGKFIFNTDGVISFINKKASTLLMEPLGNLIGKKIDILKSSTGMLVTSNMLNYAINNGYWNGEVELINEHYEKIPIMMEIYSLPVGDEAVFVAAMYDISLHKNITNALTSEKEKLSITLASIEDGVISTRSDGQIILVNKAAKKILGIIDQEPLGEKINDAIEIYSVNNHNKRIDFFNYFSGRSEMKGPEEFYLIDYEKKKREIEANVSFCDMDGGRGLVFVFRDISRRHSLEEEVQRIQKLESLGTLAGGIAHDFNNILMGIVGNITLAKMALDPADRNYKFLSDAEGAVFRARDLTQQLLTFSKGGSPVKISTSLEEFIKSTVAIALRGSNVSVEYYFQDKITNIDIDVSQIGQVINNVVLNAKQAMPNGGLLLVLAQNIDIAQNDDLPLKTGKYAKISFIDHGEGIPRENFSRIFDPFFSTREVGRGLGLSTAYSIIKQHNGHITVESEPGKGARFNIYLPTSETDETVSQPVSMPMIKVEKESGNKRVLIMDDEELVREVLGEIMKRFGFSVEYASNGEEVLLKYKKSIEENSFDLVIMDLTIPAGMGGKETISELLKIDPTVVALISSGYANDPVISDFEKYGFRGVMVKPYRVEDIARLLKNLFHTIE